MLWIRERPALPPSSAARPSLTERRLRESVQRFAKPRHLFVNARNNEETCDTLSTLLEREGLSVRIHLEPSVDAPDRLDRPRSLPLIQGLEHLGFRCTGCGNCCRSLRVAVTHHDLLRLVRATAEPGSALVAWLSPDEVDMTGEPGSFVELGVGRRLMVLAQREGACRQLDENARCRVYAARPYDCRLFPFNIDRSEESSGGRLSLLSLTDCDYARDGDTNAERLAEDDALRWQELADYQGAVARWNRLARHRRRLRRPVGDAAAFLSFLGFEA